MSLYKIEKTAQSILKKHDIREPAVQVDQIAAQEGIKILYETCENDDVSGMLYRQGSNGIMIINEANHERRQRFTIAHELGHYFLHKGDTFVSQRTRIHFRDARSGQAVDRQEIQANQFAAALLMPAEWVLDSADNSLADEPNLTDDTLAQKLSKQFNVSSVAMKIRLGNLGLLNDTNHN